MLAALSLWTGLVVPILDAEEWNHGTVVESAHDPDQCVRGHDHTICTQVVASRALPSDGSQHNRAAPAQPFVTMHTLGEWASLHPPFASPLGSRAPPA